MKYKTKKRLYCATLVAYRRDDDSDMVATSLTQAHLWRLNLDDARYSAEMYNLEEHPVSDGYYSHAIDCRLIDDDLLEYNIE